MKDYFYLAIAILSEVVGTTALKASEAFTRPIPSLVVVVAYAVTFYFLSACLRAINIGVAYAIWSGVGIVLITLLGWLVYGQTIDQAGVIGMGLIILGVIVLNVFSEAVTH
jgi:multidrug transporter EmrE-like cation transporter